MSCRQGGEGKEWEGEVGRRGEEGGWGGGVGGEREREREERTGETKNNEEERTSMKKREHLFSFLLFSLVDPPGIEPGPHRRQRCIQSLGH